MVRGLVVLLLMAMVMAMVAGCSRKGQERMDTFEAAVEELAGELVPVEDVELVPVELGGAGVAARIGAPADAAVRRRFDAVQVTVADGSFGVEVRTAEARLDERKRVIAENDRNRLVEYIVDDGQSLLYESRRDDQSEFHVLVYVTLGGVTLECQDRKHERYTLPQAQTMLRACRSLAPGDAP